MATFIPRVSRLSNLVTRVLGCNPGAMTLQGTNTYIVGSGARRLLIDTGDSGVPEYLDNLQEALGSEKCQLSHIVVTHWHHDHIGGIPGVLGLAGNDDVDILKYPRIDAPDEVLENVDIKRVENGHVLSVEGASLRLIHTPGHTTDHLILYLEEENSIFSGDCILGEGTAVFEDLHDYMLSLRRILELNPSRIYPGHGPVIDDPNSKIQYYISHRNLRESQIMGALSSASRPLGSMDLVRTIYQDTPAQLHRAAQLNVEHHLTKLKKEGKVLDRDGKWSAC